MSKDRDVREGPWLTVFGKGQKQCTRFGVFCLHGTQPVFTPYWIEPPVVVLRTFHAVQTDIMPEIH